MSSGYLVLLFLLGLLDRGLGAAQIGKAGHASQPGAPLGALGFIHGGITSSNGRSPHTLYAKQGSNRKEVFNKRDVVSEVADRLNKTQKDVGQVVDEFLATVKKHLSNDSQVMLSKFGVFKNSLRGERRMRNLQTGQVFTAKPVHVPSLRFYDTFKADVNNKLRSKRSSYNSY